MHETLKALNEKNTLHSLSFFFSYSKALICLCKIFQLNMQVPRKMSLKIPLRSQLAKLMVIIRFFFFPFVIKIHFLSIRPRYVSRAFYEKTIFVWTKARLINSFSFSFQVSTTQHHSFISFYVVIEFYLQTSHTFYCYSDKRFPRK